ncbi:MAG TPA: hypothetical protein VJ596_12595 [Gemmatimonadaceae bacterium]|nr:hypothetical protein [Gemmatimonadaceae bacterium]
MTFSRSVAKVARELPPLQASDTMLERIAASRDAGARFILPGDEERHVHASPRRRVALIAAAAIAIAAVGVASIVKLLGDSRARTGDTAVTDAPPPITALFVSVGVLPTSAAAQELPPAPQTAMDPRRMEPMALVYERRWHRSSTNVAPGGRGTLKVMEATAQGEDAWLVESIWTGLSGGPDESGVRVQADSVYLSRRTLQPIARRVHATPYRRFPGITIRQRFHGDSVLGEMTISQPPIRRPIARQVRGLGERVIPSEALGRIFLMGARLDATWQAELAFLGWAVVPTDVVYPFSLRVVGSERVTVPAGTFDCWKLAVVVGGKTQWSWVRKSDHLGVMTRDESMTSSYGAREVVLSSESRETR